MFGGSFYTLSFLATVNIQSWSLILYLLVLVIVHPWFLILYILAPVSHCTPLVPHFVTLWSLPLIIVLFATYCILPFLAVNFIIFLAPICLILPFCLHIAWFFFWLLIFPICDPNLESLHPSVSTYCLSWSLILPFPQLKFAPFGPSVHILHGLSFWVHNLSNLFSSSWARAPICFHILHDLTCLAPNLTIFCHKFAPFHPSASTYCMICPFWPLILIFSAHTHHFTKPSSHMF